MIPEVKAAQTDTSVASDAVKALLYFDIFNYPLKLDEIRQSSQLNGTSDEALVNELKALEEQGCLYRFGAYYAMQNDAALVQKRELGNVRADQLMRKAYKMSRFIARFPYVRGVLLSGSISKGYIDDDGDIDYFIITEPGRLWLARTCLIAFKKIFLFNSRKYFCVNYFVDTNHLDIEEKNLFTAMELVTLMPTYGKDYYEQFYHCNQWAKAYYPNFPMRDANDVQVHKAGIIKRFQEWMLNNKLGNALDRYFMKVTVNHWKRKFESFDASQFDVAMKSRRYVSKHHPQNFQKKVIDRYQEKIDAFEAKHNISLS